MLVFIIIIGLTLLAALGGLVKAYEWLSERNYKDPDEVFAVVVIAAIYIAVILWFFFYFEPKYL